MAITSIRSGDAPANTCTQRQAAEFLGSYTVNGERIFPDPNNIDLAYILGDLEGLLAFIAAAYEDATNNRQESNLLHLDPNIIIGTMKCARRIAALATLTAEAI